MNGANFNLSSLLCSRGNVWCSKEPKYTSKPSSTHPYWRTYALSKQFQEIECQSKCAFRWDIRTRKTCTTRTSLSNYSLAWRLAFKDIRTCSFQGHENPTWKCSFQRKFSAGFANKLQFCWRGQSQALLHLRSMFCWFIWLKNINIDWCWFLRLILNSSSTTRKW